MAHQSTIVENGMTYNVTEFDHTAQEIDDAVSNLGGASTPQGAIAALGAGVRPKLNDNPFFLVNQRGQSSYTVNGYTVDRWKMGTNTATLDILSDGVKITLNQAPSNDMRLLHQIIEDPQRLISKTIIAAFYVTAVTGTGFQCGFRANSGTISYQYANITQPGLYTALFTVPSGCTELLLTTLALAGTPSGQSITISAATAEIGNTQTLAYQDDSGAWQLLERPDPLELLKCQRYQRVISAIGSNLESPFFSGYISASQKTLYISIPLAVPMRTTPSVSINNATITIRTVSGYSPYATYDTPGNLPSAFARLSADGGFVNLQSNLPEALGENNTPCTASLRSGRIILDANL